MPVTFPGESPEYRVARNRSADVKLSELSAPGKESLVLYSFMFPRDPGDQSPGPATGQTAELPLAEGPCPSCHFWSSKMFDTTPEPGQEPRHVGTIEPLWNLLDLTPEGRPKDWYEQISYA